MLSCPRCGTGNLKEGCSFSMHLAQFYSGPTLLCHAQPGLLQSKCSYEQMLSKSSCTSFQQQIRAFNLMTCPSSYYLTSLLTIMKCLCRMLWGTLLMVHWCNFIASQLQYLMQSNGLDRQITFLNTFFPIKYLTFFISVVYLNLFLNNVVVPSAKIIF
jgi:hypothetical protein